MVEKPTPKRRATKRETPAEAEGGPTAKSKKPAAPAGASGKQPKAASDPDKGQAKPRAPKPRTNELGVRHPAAASGALSTKASSGPDLTDAVFAAELAEAFLEQFDAAGMMQVVTFLFGDEEYGVPISQVREIIRCSQVKLVDVPNAPRYCLGVVNLRGQIVPVIDVAGRFGMAGKDAGASSRMMILTVGPFTFGVIVDAVTEVAKVSAGDIGMLPDLAVGVDSAYVVGAIRMDDRVVIVLDLDLMFSGDETGAMSAFGRSAAESGL